MGVDERDNLDLFGRAIEERRKVHFAYCDAEGGGSERIVWPLALHYWGKVRTLAAWCELRKDFRTFRADRAEAVALTDERFRREPGRTLEDYLARVTCAP